MPTSTIKISQLSAGAALAGTEVLPAVQGGATVAVTVNQLRAGMAAAAHAHAVGDTTGLQAALDGKAAATLSNVANSDFADKAAAAGVGGGGGVSLGSSTPQALGTAAAGSATVASRQDHVHAMPTAAQVGAATAVHAHSVGDTTGLQAALDGKLAQGKHTVWIPAGAMTARTTAGAATGTVETTTNKVMRVTKDFDPATTEYAQFTVAMPKSWNEGAVSFQALWTAASGSGGVAWGLQGVAVSDLENLDAAFGTAQIVADTLGTAGYLHQTGESAAVTVAGAPAENDLVIFQLYRDVANGSDTLGVDALLLGVRLFYTVNAGNDA
jgi:hypothetical protein